MSLVSNPFGCRPVWHPNGTIRPYCLPLTKALMDALPTLKKNQAVQIDPTGRLAAAANAADWIGVFQGAEYTDLQSGRPTISNQWINGTLVKDLGNESGRVYFTRDPEIVYEIMGSGTIPISAVGEQAAFANIGAGTADGFSQAQLDVATLAAAQNMMKVLSVARYPDNDWGDAFTIVNVQIARHQETALKLGY